MHKAKGSGAHHGKSTKGKATVTAWSVRDAQGQHLQSKRDDAHKLRAMVIDEGALSRSVLASMLRAIGIGTVTMAMRPEDARRLVKAALLPFDVIVSDFHFKPRGKYDMTGQDLLDELRQARGLPMNTAFIMVTDESRYQHVADCVEGALDDYLLKPFTPGQFEDRLNSVLMRKQALKRVFDAIEAEDFEGAAALCQTMFEADGEYKIYAARIATELYLRLNKLAEAKAMFEALLAFKALPWAKLGLAKVALSTGNAAQASNSLQALLAEDPGYADAYDVYGRALFEELDFASALQIYAKAVELTPGNISRLQKLGALELFLGKSEEAAGHLGAALMIGPNSRALDFQSLVSLAIANLDLKEKRGWERSFAHIEDSLERYPDSYRFKMLRRAIEVVAVLEREQFSTAKDMLMAMSNELQGPDFVFEMACNFLQLIVRCGARYHLADAPRWVRIAAERFCVSKQSARLLELSVAAIPVLEEEVTQAFNRINEESRRAMTHLVSKQHAKTVQELIAVGERTKNARIFSLARATLDRHSAAIEPALAEELSAVVDKLQESFAAYGTRNQAGLKLRQRIG